MTAARANVVTNQPRRSSVPSPSSSEVEAKSRFVLALNKGVDLLLDLGHGRERASTELLTAIGSSPDESEIFQTMESFGISWKDAAKVATVSAAFRMAQTTKGGSVAAVDELTSRLNLANITRKGTASRSPSPSPSVTSSRSAPRSTKMIEVAKNDMADSQSRSSAATKKGQRSIRVKPHHHQQGKGRKRILAEKMLENSKVGVMLEEPKNNAADFHMKEKIAKLSKSEGKKPKSLTRAKSPDGLGVRGKRTAALHAEESNSNKRTKTHAAQTHTEESIATI